MTGGWRQLDNEDLHNLHSSLNISRLINIRMMKWVGHVSHMEEVINAQKFDGIA